MSVSHARASLLGGVLALTLALLAAGPPALAADGPETAVDELLALIPSGDLTRLDEFVCQDRLDAVIREFDPAIALGLPAVEAELGASLAFRLDDIGVEVIDEQDDRALVRLSATKTLQIDAAQERELVRVMAGVDGDALDDAGLDEIAPLVLQILREPQPIETELRLDFDGQRWLVCGGLGDATLDTQRPEESVSFDGICGLVPLADVNALGPAGLTYGSNEGGEDYCAYASTAPGADYSATLSLARGEDLELFRVIFPDGIELTVAEQPAYLADGQLFAGLEQGVLIIDAFPGTTPPAGFEAEAYTRRLAELFIPLIPDLEASQDVEAGVDSPGGSLCEALSTAELTALSGLAFDEAAGDPSYCAYSNASEDAGFYAVLTSLEGDSLADLKLLYPGGDDYSVAGRPAYAEGDQLWVALEDDVATFSVGLYVEELPDSDALDTIGVARQIAEVAIPALPTGSEPGA